MMAQGQYGVESTVLALTGGERWKLHYFNARQLQRAVGKALFPIEIELNLISGTAQQAPGE